MDVNHIRTLPESQVVWQRLPPSPAALVIRCARDALIHGCVLHPHPTDMKHIRILPVWQRPPPSPAALVIRCAGDALIHGCVLHPHPYPARLAATASLTGGVGDTVCRRCSYTRMCLHPHPTDMKHIRILPESQVIWQRPVEPSSPAAVVLRRAGEAHIRTCFASISYPVYL
ncbi:hypothetical protein BT96DRAFT_1005698 [Gymnopus androsaceus JB14]|uniref:Uncharacterized protein n=1 Tax=Gymnopus androsaceus JB14 TaxID=1447944 RepID=A0A6A4GMZ4_9AGAR|nr:hypothetical protein BT96DRAFT_1005698 [Gymnopus androsaceus JB14]